MTYKVTEGLGLSRPICKRGGRTRLSCGARAGGPASALEAARGTRPLAQHRRHPQAGRGEAAQRAGPAAATRSDPDAASRSAPRFSSEKWEACPHLHRGRAGGSSQPQCWEFKGVLRPHPPALCSLKGCTPV